MKTNNLPGNVDLPSMEFELADVEAIQTLLKEAEGNAFASKNSAVFALKVTIENKKREWLTRNQKKRIVLAKYFFQLKKLMPNLDVAIEYAEVYGKEGEPILAEDLEEDTIYVDD